MQGRPSFIGMLIKGVNRGGGTPITSEGPTLTVDGDTNRSATPSGQPTQLGDQPQGVDVSTDPRSAGTSGSSSSGPR
jgi:hypothetical protein